MKTAIFSTKSYDREFFLEANKKHHHEITFFEPHLTQNTSKLAFGFEAVCAFVNDQLNEDVLSALSKEGVRLIALRCAGFNNIDLKAAKHLGLTIARVPAYSVHGVAEHAVALILSLNRKTYRAYNRIREGNFSLEGLLGFELHGKTIGIIGTGKIGAAMARIMQGFSMKVLAFDPYQNPECINLGVEYVSINTILEQSDVISLHIPLTNETKHLINADTLNRMKQGVMLINTSRGALIDTSAVIDSLKSGKIGYLGLDVYEEEDDLFFEDLSGNIIQDDTFARLLTFPNVIITGHQAFFTRTALTNIADTTLQNISNFKTNSINPQNIVTLNK